MLWVPFTLTFYGPLYCPFSPLSLSEIQLFCFFFKMQVKHYHHQGCLSYLCGQNFSLLYDPAVNRLLYVLCNKILSSMRIGAWSFSSLYPLPLHLAHSRCSSCGLKEVQSVILLHTAVVAALSQQGEHFAPSKKRPILTL